MDITIKKKYHANGNLSIEVPYKGDKKHGLYKQYYDNGKIEAEISLIDDEKDGLSSTYFKNGKVKHKTLYVMGLRNGLSVGYYNNGVIKSETSFKNNLITGIAKLYDRKGNLEYETPYENDIVHGVARSYNADGSLAREATFINGEKQINYENNLKDINNFENKIKNKNKILNEYNNLVKFINTNYDKITCAEYEKTLDYILDCSTYRNKIIAYIKQYREGYNSIDIDFLENIDSELSIDNSKISLITEKIMEEIDEVDFELALIKTTYNYFEVNVEEYEDN